MACNVCDELNRAINRATPGSDTRKLYEYKLIWHLAFQGSSDCMHGIVLYVVNIGYIIEAHRNYYYLTRAKAVRHPNCDLSIIIDASGGTGTVFQPHMMSMEKGEPERHELLKCKCTFAKVE